MKRSWETIRTVLEHVEDECLVDFIEEVDSRERNGRNKGITPDEIMGHLWLCIDAELVADADVRRNDSGEFRYRIGRNFRLTMQGHDVLDALRSDTVWDKVNNTAKAASVPLTVELIKATIAYLAKTAF